MKHICKHLQHIIAIFREIIYTFAPLNLKVINNDRHKPTERFLQTFMAAAHRLRLRRFSPKLNFPDGSMLFDALPYYSVKD
jgi:hypothetical protein